MTGFTPKDDSRTTEDPSRRSGDRRQDHPAVRDERHEEAQHAAHDDGRDLTVLDVHPNEHDALDGQGRGGDHGERRPPEEGGRNDQPDRTDEFKDAEKHPGFARQRTKGLDVRADLVEHEDLHGARRSVEERGKDLQDPQQDVHRVPPPGFRIGITRDRLSPSQFWKRSNSLTSQAPRYPLSAGKVATPFARLKMLGAAVPFSFNSGAPGFRGNRADRKSDSNSALEERFEREPFLERAGSLVTRAPPA